MHRFITSLKTDVGDCVYAAACSDEELDKPFEKNNFKVISKTHDILKVIQIP